eukprot:CAMPEP_0194132408 /NCGR_PEP_ID=MMETSP0152-20130528/2893_1 /TAXON_ID=1049557 /ORGANISM="Thalassiothrix antarctica, Strain L6-D1" /LENGTH=164 /DNA_ID=CAMNT_0038827461 /DNA_START=15 /DNA_END=509 /DNA_ORIENTATION=+
MAVPFNPRFVMIILSLCLADGFSPLHRNCGSPIQGKMGYTTQFAVKISTPSPDAAAEMGIRDWPQQLKSGTWSEKVEEGQEKVRYILDGTGKVEITENDGTSKTESVGPGSLLEISDEVALDWKSDSDEMIILTPGYEETGIFIGVALGLLISTVVATTALSGK